MATLKPISGKFGTVKFTGTEVTECRTWTLSKTSDNKPYSSCSTAGQKRRVAGTKDWTASITIYLQDGKPPAFDEGDIGLLELFTDQTAGSGGKYSGQGIVESIEPECDIEGGELVSANIAFAADGVMTFIPNP